MRVSAAEYAALRIKAEAMAMTPAHWLREAALTRRLPSPTVSAINREQYAELARLAANLNHLTRLASRACRIQIRPARRARLIAAVAAIRGSTERTSRAVMCTTI